MRRIQFSNLLVTCEVCIDPAISIFLLMVLLTVLLLLLLLMLMMMLMMLMMLIKLILCLVTPARQRRHFVVQQPSALTAAGTHTADLLSMLEIHGVV